MTAAQQPAPAAALPGPMTPPDCDLRGLPSMFLDCARLCDSDFAAIASGDEFKAGVLLWCKSWDQIPAASLPDDDRILASLSGTGRDWPIVKAVALHGWVRCSDGRLYHPVVAEKALVAWQHRLDQRAKSAKGNAKRWAKAEAKPVPAGIPAGIPAASPQRSPDHPKGEGEVKKESSDLRSGPPEAEPCLRLDIRSELFGIGTTTLAGLTGLSGKKARTAIGGMLKRYGDDASRVLAAIRAAADLNPAIPMAWIEARLRSQQAGQGGFAALLERELGADHGQHTDFLAPRLAGATP